MEALIAGAAAALIGVFAGRRLGSARDIEVFSGRIGAIERLLGDNGISASLPDTLEKRMALHADTKASAAAKSAAAMAVSTVQELIAKAMDQRDQELIKVMEFKSEAVVAALRAELAEKVDTAVTERTKDLISRSEVQEAFARVAQIEAQRINSERQAQEAAARQQAMRAQAVFGAPAMPPEMNTAINNQLAALNERLQQIGASMPAP